MVPAFPLSVAGGALNGAGAITVTLPSSDEGCGSGLCPSAWAGGDGRRPIHAGEKDSRITRGPSDGYLYLTIGTWRDGDVIDFDFAGQDDRPICREDAGKVVHRVSAGLLRGRGTD